MRSSILTSFIFIIISLSLSITAYASSQSSVYLLDKISIKGPSITLGKISIIETQDLSLKQQLSTISLGPIPKVGGQVQISAYKIKKILQEKGLSNIEINGLQTHIQVSEKSIDKNMIQNMISKEIHHAFSDFQDISIQYIKIPKEWKVPDSEDLDFHIDMTKGKLKKHMTASLRASINNRILATLHLRLKINAFKNLLVAAQQ